MRIFLFIILSLLATNCTTVNVTKEVIKVTNTVTNQVKKSVSNNESELEIIVDTKEIEKIEEKKEVEKNIIEGQQKLVEINFIGKTEMEISNLLGQAQLNRIDGVIYTQRYDSVSCRLFLFFNQEITTKRVEYFELRNTKAELLNSKKLIEKCYKELNLTN